MRDDHRQASDVGPSLPPCSRERLLFAASYTSLVGLQASGNSPASTSHVVRGAWDYKMLPSPVFGGFWESSPSSDIGPSPQPRAWLLNVGSLI